MTDALLTLETNHRLEEVCEPYGLYPDLSDTGILRLPARQLEPGGCAALTDALIAQLGGDACVEDGVIRWTPGPGAEGASALEAALYAIRPLHPARFLGRRREGSAVPTGESLQLPRSAGYLDRLVAGDFMPADKKPTVLDLFRSSGPYLAGVDDDPLVIFDAAGQIATHAGGLNPPEILEAYWTGEFGALPLDNPDTRGAWTPEVTRLATTLRDGAGGHLPHVAFAGSGAHANEIALRAAAEMRPGCRAIVAFEGGFHGRTLLALHTTWNPKKRERFELDGFQARWVPWPAWDQTVGEPDAGDLAGWDQRADGPRPAPEGADDLLLVEWEALNAVQAAMSDDGAVAVLIEPMQSEGGERYITERFAVRLRALTTAYGVPLIVDEVQTGFGLGGPFFWHRLWALPSPPDLVTVAKKAQLGAVLSQRPLASGAEAHVVSAIRGSLQAAIMATGDPEGMEANVRRRLDTLANAHPSTVLAPRLTAYCFGFDLPDAASVQAVISERLWRGYMLYGAGSTALRFRLHPHITDAALDALFQRLDTSLGALESATTRPWAQEALPDPTPPWPPRMATVAAGYQIREITHDDWPNVQADIAALQEACYEPARRDNLVEMGALLQDRDSIYLELRHGATDELVGTAFAYALEHAASLGGPDIDPMLGRGNTVYSADVTVHPGHRGHGLGFALKEDQIRRSMMQTRPDGSPRYSFMTGRNKVGATAAMQELNRRFGAWTVTSLTGQYGQADGKAQYYRIPLTAPRLPEVARPATGVSADLDLTQGTHRPLGDLGRGSAGVDELVQPYERGAMAGGVVNKLSLCNFVTPGVVRSVEVLRALAPRGMEHLVMANSREEICDKGLRSIKFHRGEGSLVISVGPVDAGTTTAASRSISLPADHPENWFGWPTTADPTVDPDQALADLESHVAQAGAERVLAAVIEPVYGRTGRSVPEDFWGRLRATLDRHGVPLVTVEHTTGGYRSGTGMWRSDSLPIRPDALWWYPGGQLGLIYVSDALYVPDKLTLISTWDGDEVSLSRLSWTLRAARHLPVKEVGDALGQALQSMGTVHGEGLYRMVETEDAEVWQQRLAADGIRVDRQGLHLIRIEPPLNLSMDDLKRIRASTSRSGTNQ